MQKNITKKASQPILRLYFYRNVLITIGNEFFWLECYLTEFIHPFLCENFAQKVDLECEKVLFSCFSTNILVYCGFLLMQVPKKCLKRGVPFSEKLCLKF